ncbi:2-amino-4-hydroxy-6-hydroxymethyldihydropteridine diphosphokinase [Loktanella ponticola]|uniref:2-amino-4-hydroxy-6-hydroxymethyldihydropteridine pyrophosphokinase n=1 Tax=Yoonia ponticola TaxID=1524255 RepID=A0A7W9EY20_9RHOB|nr:2-amino-4-hydroxy-6-hydroxymethyldihydropteridine diphosphokinase [Yoonia ponticola]
MVSQVQRRTGFHHDVVLALGANQTSNLGKPEEIVIFAIQNLSDRLGAPIRKSSLYQTPAFPVGAGPDFVNAAVAFQTDKAAADVLAICHEIEELAGRTREVRWGPRTLDIDLIAFGDQILPDLAVHQHWRDLPIEDQTTQTPAELIVPHPRVQDRAFVLIPMMDVAPHWRHPVLGLTTAEMLDARSLAEKAEIHRLDAA